jgi:hypothetical protein
MQVGGFIFDGSAQKIVNAQGHEVNTPLEMPLEAKLAFKVGVGKEREFSSCGLITCSWGQGGAVTGEW